MLPTYGNGVVSDYTLSNRVSASNVCYIEASRLNSNASETIRNMINEGKCRWIDYIEDEKQNVDKNGDKVITRLSFK